jgi:Quercetinase C-terminal cupin domain
MPNPDQLTQLRTPCAVTRVTPKSRGGCRFRQVGGSVTIPSVWILPARRGLAPSYERRHLPETEKRDRLRLVGDPDGNDDAVGIYRDVRLYAACLDMGHIVEHAIGPNRDAWAQVARGAATLNGHDMKEGDGKRTSRRLISFFRIVSLVTGDRERCNGDEQHPSKMLPPRAPSIAERAEGKYAGERYDHPVPG